MAQHRFIEHDGQRIEIDANEPEYEYSCDVCGRFATRDQLDGADITLRAQGLTPKTEHYDVHRKCMPALIQTVAHVLVQFAAQS